MTQENRPGLEAYANYALTLGWDPIPLYGTIDGVCVCRNGKACGRSSGKHPIQLDWQARERLTKPDVYDWFAMQDHPVNIGLRTGVRSGFWALDIDPKHAGDEALLSLEAVYGQLPATRVHRTGSGGRHYLFRLPKDFEVTNSRGRLPSGIDVRGNGGFIVGPGSVTGVGPYRTLSSADVAPAPDWLLELIRPQTIDRQIEVVESIEFEALAPEAQAKATRYLESAVAGEVQRLQAMREAASSDGSNYSGEPWNQTTYEVACNLLELAQSQWLNFGIEDVKRLLAENAPTDPGFTTVDVMGRLASAFNKVRGQARPMPASINTDSWELLIAGVERYVPKDDDGEAVTEWPEESWDQVGNAKRTIRLAAGRLAFVPEQDTWYECGQNGVWGRTQARRRADSSPAKWCGRAMEAAKLLEAHNYSSEPSKKKTARGEVDDASPAEKFAKFMDLSSKVEMHSAVAAQMAYRSEDWGISVPESRFNTRPDEFACANGLVNLRTGELRPVRREDYVSVASPVVYDPEMPIPHFRKYLESSQPDPDIRDFLHKALGYSMTGEHSEQKMFLHHGAETANGKSVLVNILSLILGGHLSPASEKTIIRQKGMSSQRIGQDMVDLRGYRMLVLSETAEGGILDSEAVKSITSADLRADRPHARENIQYRVTGKVHLMTNNLPHIVPDAAMRRRLVLIPWTQSFEKNPDPNLNAKLAGEAPGILAWLVAGARRWYADFEASGRTGLIPPAVILDALEAFVQEEDEVGTWLSESAVMMSEKSEPKTWARSKDVYADYLRWRMLANLQGRPLTPNAFGRRLTGKGIPAATIRSGDTTAKVRALTLRSAVDAMAVFGL